jgi:hypothetical protein
MMIVSVVSQDLLMEVEVHLTAPTHTHFCSILIHNSNYTHMSPFIVMCSPEAELYLPPNICGCASSALPYCRGSWCPLNCPETTVCFVANVSIMFRHKIRTFLVKVQSLALCILLAWCLAWTVCMSAKGRFSSGCCRGDHQQVSPFTKIILTKIKYRTKSSSNA